MRQTLSRLHLDNHNNPSIKATPDNKQALPHASTSAPCLNHHDKLATHTLPHPETHQHLYYCEKCSIMLASKGHNVVKVGRGNSSVRRGSHKEAVKSERQRQIEAFIGQLSYNIDEIGKRYQESEDILLCSEQHFNTLTCEITSYFKQIQDILEIQKYMSYNAVLSHRATLEADLRLLREGMQQQVEELANIGNDIQNNMEAVQMVELPIYESIMHNYRHKLELSCEFHDLQLSYLPRPALLFPDIPKMLYSLADKITLRAQPLPNPTPIQTILIPHAFGKPSLSNRSNPSRHQSCENSRGKININTAEQFRHQKSKKSLTNLASHKNTESTDKQIVFSFESNEQNQIHKALFGIRSRQTFHPQEMMLRESLSLTQIRQNEQECEYNGNRRYGGLLEETIPIPEEVMTSQESIAGYFANTLNYSNREGNERGEETETLLIC